MTKILSLVREGMQDSARNLSRDLRNAAAEAGWPAEAIRGLSVEFSKDRFHIRANNKDIDDLEFGGAETRPSAVIRRWLADSAHLTEEIKNGIVAKTKGVVK